MAKYDHGGGCPCGLQKVCDCDLSKPKPAGEPNELTPRGMELYMVAGFALMLKQAGGTLNIHNGVLTAQDQAEILVTVGDDGWVCFELATDKQ